MEEEEHDTELRDVLGDVDVRDHAGAVGPDEGAAQEESEHRGSPGDLGHQGHGEDGRGQEDQDVAESRLDDGDRHARHDAGRARRELGEGGAQAGEPVGALRKHREPQHGHRGRHRHQPPVPREPRGDSLEGVLDVTALPAREEARRHIPGALGRLGHLARRRRGRGRWQLHVTVHPVRGALARALRS